MWWHALPAALQLLHAAYMAAALSSPNILSRAQWEQTIVPSTTPEAVRCVVALNPYSIFEPAPSPDNPQVFSLEPDSAFIIASLTFTLLNSGSAILEAPWELAITSMHYRSLLEVIKQLCCRVPSHVSMHDCPLYRRVEYEMQTCA